MEIKIKGPDRTEACLTKEQFDIIEDIVVDMMNGNMKLDVAEEMIVLKLKEANLPLEFKPQAFKEGSRTTRRLRFTANGD